MRKILLSLSLLALATPAAAQPKSADGPNEVNLAQATEGLSGKGPLMVKIETSEGIIVARLFEQQAPNTVANFVGLARGKKRFQDPKDGKWKTGNFYDGLIFHRVIPNFMVQGGGFTPNMQQKQAEGTIENEAKNGLKNVRGSIAMARTSAPHSASSQFFINLKDNGFLDYPGQDGWGYCVFGKVTKGLEVIDAMAAVKTARNGPHGDVPTEPIVIVSAKVSE